MVPYVFISYKSEEYSEAAWVKNHLEAEGISCWMAPASMPGGSNYAFQIPRAIRECSAFLIVLSQKAQTSKWIPRELDQAINQGKLILPFCIDSCPLQDNFSFYLSNVQRYDAERDRSQALRDLIRDLRQKGQYRQAQAIEVPYRPAVKSKWLPPVILLCLALIMGLTLILLLRAGSDPDSAADPGSEVLVWTDINLERAVRSRKGLEGEITIAQAENIDELSLDASDISDISSLRYFTGIQKLSLADNFIEDLTPLASLTNLHDLNLEKNEVRDVSPLRNLYGLRRLDLCQNNLTDITPLSGLTKLANLDLRENDVSDLSPLESMVSMEELYLSDNYNLSDITPLLKMNSLSYLGLKDTRIQDISVLSGLDKLDSLILGGTGVQDLSPIEKIRELSYLDIRGCPIKDKEVLDRLRKRGGIKILE